MPTQPPGLTRDELNKLIADRNGGIGANHLQLDRELDARALSGSVTCSGRGVKGSPFRYIAATDDAAPGCSALSHKGGMEI
jgi:hypothetical protein